MHGLLWDRGVVVCVRLHQLAGFVSGAAASLQNVGNMFVCRMYVCVLVSVCGCLLPLPPGRIVYACLAVFVLQLTRLDAHAIEYE